MKITVLFVFDQLNENFPMQMSLVSHVFYVLTVRPIKVVRHKTILSGFPPPHIGFTAGFVKAHMMNQMILDYFFFQIGTM